MTKDYKSQPSTPRARRGRRGSCFFWFVTGAVLGGFGVGLAWMLKQPVRPGPVTAAKTHTAPLTKPRFDFYSILPEMEVVVPDKELEAKAPPRPRPLPPPPPPTTPTPQAQAPKPPERQPERQAPKPPPTTAEERTSYFLQVASFRAQSDAERVKARLALLGVHAQIQRVTINNRDTFHRVQAGPFRSKQALNQARALLSSNGFRSIPVRLR
jgi:cell division protein FtsN